MRVVLPNVKAHLVVTLVAFLATSLAIEDAAHEGVVHHPHVMELLNMAPTSALDKRHLRFNLNVTSIDANGSEERASLEGVAVKAQEIGAKIVSPMVMKWWMLTKNSDTLFASLKLQDIKVDLLSNTKFLKWKKFVKNKYGDGAHGVIMETMIGRCEDVASEAMVIFEGTPRRRVDLVYLEPLQWKLLLKWKESGITLQQLLQYLNPGGDANALINNRPLFQAWWGFATSIGLGYREDLGTLTKAYDVPGVVQALGTATKDLHAGSLANVVKDEFAEDLIQLQLRIWFDDNKHENDVFHKALQINKADSTSITSLVSVYLDYVLMRVLAHNKNKVVLNNQVDDHYLEAVLEQVKKKTANVLRNEVSTEWKKILGGEEVYVHLAARCRRVSRARTRAFKNIVLH